MYERIYNALTLIA